jgi:signal peptidase I
MDTVRAGSLGAPPRPVRRRWAGRLLLATLLLALAGTIGAGAWARHEGYQAYVVHTGSMSPGLPPGDLLIDKRATAPYHDGQVVTFKVPQGPGSDPVVTHRIYALHGEQLRTKGDANTTPDEHRVPTRDVVGEVMFKIPYGGYVLVYLSQVTGWLSIVTVLLTITFAWGMFFSEDAASGRPRGRRPAR